MPHRVAEHHTTSSAAWPIDPVDALAADGSIVHLRPMTAEDTDAARELHTSVSRRNRYLRCFIENHALTHQ